MEIRRTLEDLPPPEWSAQPDGTQFRPSVYDVPRAITVQMDPMERTLQVIFEYVDTEESVQEEPAKNVMVVRGRHSGKLLRFRLAEVDFSVPGQLLITLQGTIRKESDEATKANQRLNYKIVEDVLSTRLEPMLQQVGQQP